jgi:hypothetical protein
VNWNPLTSQQPLPRPIIRAQAADDVPETKVPGQLDNRVVVLHLPPPEELGICSSASTGAADWAEFHKQLSALGVTYFHCEKSAQGCRMTCLLPSSVPGRIHRIDALAADDVEAIRVTLAKAAEGASRR